MACRADAAGCKRLQDQVQVGEQREVIRMLKRKLSVIIDYIRY